MERERTSLIGSSITVTNENSRMSSPHQDGQTDALKARAQLMMLQDRIESGPGTEDSRIEKLQRLEPLLTINYQEFI